MPDHHPVPPKREHVQRALNALTHTIGQEGVPPTARLVALRIAWRHDVHHALTNDLRQLDPEEIIELATIGDHYAESAADRRGIDLEDDVLEKPTPEADDEI